MTPTFRNLKFRPKKYDKKCIAATLELKPKVFLSVVAGPGLYSSPGGIGKNRDDLMTTQIQMSLFHLNVLL